MSKLINIGGGQDDVAYFKDCIQQLKEKTLTQSYTQKRAFEMEQNMAEMQLESELQMAFEDISQKEKDFAQLFQISEFLFDKNEELHRRVQEDHDKVQHITYQNKEFEQRLNSI